RSARGLCPPYRLPPLAPRPQLIGLHRRPPDAGALENLEGLRNRRAARPLGEMGRHVQSADRRPPALWCGAVKQDRRLDLPARELVFAAEFVARDALPDQIGDQAGRDARAFDDRLSCQDAGATLNERTFDGHDTSISKPAEARNQLAHRKPPASPPPASEA